MSEYKKFVIKLIIVQSFSAKAFIVYVKSFPCPPFLIIKNIEDELRNVEEISQLKCHNVEMLKKYLV